MNKIVAYITVLLFLLHSDFLLAQSRGKIYTLENEEINKPKILALFQNKTGLIFCGTTNGLYRFDGFDFTRYSADAEAHASVTAITEISDKKLWIGFDNGNIGELAGNKIHLINFAEGFPKQAIRSIVQDDSGMVWIGTAGEGIYYFYHNRLYNINTDDGLSDDYVYKLVFIPKLGIVGATDRGINICSIKNGKKIIHTYTSKNGLPDNIVRSIYPSGNGLLWLGMQDAGIAAYNYSTNESKVLNGWTYGQVNDIISDDNGLLLATEDSSLLAFKYDKNNELFTAPIISHILPKVACLLKDREGNIWAAGDNQLMRTGKTEIENLITLKKTEAYQVHCLYPGPDSTIWLNITGGIASLKKYRGKWVMKKYEVSGLNNTAITALFRDPFQNTWIGSMGKGITLLNEKTGVKKNMQDNPMLANGNIISITGKNNKIWIASLEGVVQATITASGITYTTYADTASIGSKYVYDIFTDSKDRVWFATDGDGLILLDNGKFTQLKNQKGYIGKVVYKITEDSAHNIWYATYDKGLVKYNGSSFTSYTAEQGLSDAEITGLENTGTNLVVIHKNNIDLLNPYTGRINYPDKTGQVFDINTDLNACTADDAGNIYFVASGAVYSYHSKLSSQQQPTVVIDKIKLFLKEIDIQEGHSFRYNENNLSFYYSGLFYTQPEKVLYQYKVDGYSKEWVNTKDKMQNFPRLPPGDYTFKIRVSLNKDFTNAAEASFKFVIERPFWLQAWFIILCIITFAAILYFFVRQRVKRVQRWANVEKEKIQSQLQTLRSQINPHFLFNSFNTLISEIEEQPDDAVVYVEHLSDFYRSVVMYRDKDLISLDEELNILTDYCFLQQKRYNTGLSVNVDITAQQMYAWCVAPFALQLLVENAVKHNIASKEMPLHVDVSVDAENYLTISNNINPKLQKGKETGMGLQNIRQRYSLLCDKPVIIENNEQYFTVKIPLIKNTA